MNAFQSLLLAVLLTAFAPLEEKPDVPALYRACGLVGALNEEVFTTALIKAEGFGPLPDVLAVVDMTQPSTAKRLFVVDLKHRKLLDKVIQMQAEKGDEVLKKALAGPLHETKLASRFAEVAQPQEHDLVIVSGVGSVWPLLRSHSLLNNLQPVMGKTPLVMFYPGRYDGQSLRLFGKLKNNNYYRAFKLVP
ncbi:MAG TPA: DUF1788 domain-containing protein [Flavobacteriales bacterium]|nr:DUF1788 domain-containing protein [Flavobacteriales bacterium]